MSGLIASLAWVLAVGVPVVSFLAGRAVGRREQVQRELDAALRRETRLRHPSARGAAGEH